jgi:hypothetical protein
MPRATDAMFRLWNSRMAIARSQEDLVGSVSRLTPRLGESVATSRTVAEAKVTVPRVNANVH